MRRRWSAILTLLASSGAFAEAPQVSLQPSSLVLGSGKRIEVAVRLPRANLVLRSASNAGTLQTSDDAPAVERHFTWAPPKIRFPMTAILAFWVEEEDGSPPEPSIVRIPLYGRTTLEINTEPEALVRVQVASATFGPRRADKRGRVELPLEVPPGVPTAQVVAEAQGRVTTRAAPLEIPRGGRPAIAFSPDPLIRGEPCWLIVAHPGAADPTELDVELAGGRLAIHSTAPGRAVYRASPETGAKELRARASLRGESPERAEVTARIAAPEEVPVRSLLSTGHHFFASASAGGFYAGGANSGTALALDGSYALPAAAGRFTLDLEIGFRSASLSAPVQGLGSVHSSVSALSFEVALRVLAFEHRAWAVHGRLGGGVLPFKVSARSDFQPPFSQSGVALEGFASAQVGYRVRPVELFAEVRGGIAPAKTSSLDAQLGGFLFALGARYQIR